MMSGLTILGILAFFGIYSWALARLLKRDQQDRLFDSQAWLDGARQDSEELRESYRIHAEGIVGDYKALLSEANVTIRELREEVKFLIEDRQIMADTISARLGQQAKVRQASTDRIEMMQKINAERQKHAGSAPSAVIHPGRIVVGGKRMIGGAIPATPAPANGEKETSDAAATAEGS
jgi:hypothetical protein